MSKQEIERKVIEILTKSRRDGAIVAAGRDTRFEEMKLESLDVMCAVFDLEEEFNVTIPDGAAEHMKCIRDVVDSISGELEKSGAS